MANPKAIDWQAVPFPLIGGLDTKISGIALPAPKLQVCTNAYADKTGRLRKREGSELMSTVEMDGTTLSTIVATASFDDRLLAMGATKAYEYSADAGRWVDKGAMNTVRIQHRSVSKNSDIEVLACDSASSNGITAYAYFENGRGLLLTVVDEAGAVITGGAVLSATGATPRCVTHAGKLYIFWYDSAGTPAIKVKILDTTSGALLDASIAAAAVSVVTNMAVVAFNGVFDAASSSGNGVLLAYRTTTANQVAWGFVNASGVIGSTSTSATVASAIGIACAVAPSAVVHGIVYYVGTNPSDGYSLLRSWSGGAWSATATSAALDTTLGANITEITCAFDSNSTLRIWWTGDAATTTSTDNNERTVQATHTTANVVASRIRTFRHAQIASKPFSSAGVTYIILGIGDAATSIQASLFLVNTSDNSVAGIVLKDTGFYGSDNARTHGVVTLADATTYRFACIYKTLVPAGDVTIAAGKLGVMSVDLEFEHTESHKTVEAGSLYLCGGMLQQYDGVSFVESGFLRLVESRYVTPTKSVGAGALTSSVSYSFYIVPEWTNARGELERGTFSTAITVQMGVGQNTVAFAVPTITATLKEAQTPRRSSMVLAFYRTLPNPTDVSPAYRVGQVANNINADEVTFTDLMSDLTLVDQEPFYANGAELDHVCPPAASIACTGGNRVFLAGVQDPSQIWPSKLRQSGEPIAFSDALTLQVPDDGGPITGLAFLNETLIVFKKRRIYRIGGEGPSNTLDGSFFPAQLLSSDTGANTQRGIVLTPLGLMFCNEKGIFLLDQGLQVSYIGAPVEGYYPSTENGRVCISSVLLPLKQQVRFTFESAGGDLVYDYYHRQWYVFDYNNDPVGPACLWRSAYVFAIGSQNVRIEDHSLSVPTYLDDASNYTMTVRLAWLVAPSGLKQGDLRVRRIAVLLESLGVHNLRVRISKDSTPTVVETVISETDLAVGVHSLKERVSDVNQILSALQVEIDDSGTAGTASMALSEIAFEVGERARVLGRD